MKHGIVVLLLAVGMVLFSRPMAPAQLPVIDLGNLAQNSITAIESTLSAIEDAIHTAQNILNLTPLDDMVVAGGIAEDMVLLGQIAEQTEGLSYDWSSLQAQLNGLFHLETAPETRDGLMTRLQEIKTLKFQVYSYTARTQTLLKTALRTVEHLNALLETVANLIGNLQGAQNLGQYHTVATKHLANLDVQIAAFHRAQTLDQLGEAVILESITKIQFRRIEGWPSW